ncbi:nicotinate-nucleotide-dimethylbenzimidazole phosphoribosyltransferase /cob(II)yrinic acid a,c-diamide reductase [Streptomyces sp. 846.5]|nr:nicotinate-nucleotide--dimethylbenzimidazole phosphoribosyltransferase [Streptomyces sp. 846.5]TDU02791.1 nicotinate-nucleotide-dimethylbenzimidazole phosphoribosyltransferase /cob(II)yrinic acid a,c-diamide reductase [Streptomyces sp. 846.5]
MSDTGHVPTGGTTEQPLATNGAEQAPIGASAPIGEQSARDPFGSDASLGRNQALPQSLGSEGAPPPYTFLDLPDDEDDEDELLMPGPQSAWSEPAAVREPQPAFQPQVVVPEQVQVPVAAVPAPEPVAVPTAEGTVPAPSWPPLTPPTVPVVTAAPEAPAAPAPVTEQPQQAQPVVAAPRRPLHAGPPIPDPSLMTGQVPVRSLADRGPSAGGESPFTVAGPTTPPYGVPAAPAAGQYSGPEYLDQPAAVVSALGTAPTQAEPVEVAVQAPEPVAVSVPVQMPSPESTLGSNNQVQPAPAPMVESAPAAAPEPQPEAVVPFEPAPPVEAVPIPVEPIPVEPVPAEPIPVEPVAVEPSPEPAAAPAPAAEPAPLPEPPAAEADPLPEIEAEPEPVAPTPQPDAAIPAQGASPEAGGSRISAFMSPPPRQFVMEPAVEAVPDAVAEAVVVEPEPEPEPEPAVLTETPPAPIASESTAQGTGTLSDPVLSTVHPAAEAQPVPELSQQSTAVPVPEQAPEPERRVLAVDASGGVEAAETVQPLAPEPAFAAESAAAAAVTAPVLVEPEAPLPVVPEGPAAPAYDDEMRDAVHRVMRERRDIRNGFRPDPIPHEVLIRVLEAAHTAPSVGYSQPWDFVVIRSAKTRARMHELAERQREVYAESLPKGRAKQFKELKIEAIVETPVNIVVTADRTRGGRHTLGRHTQPQMAPYSAALAVENLWLAARAEGLGVGWVSFFDEQEMVRELGLPEHLDVVAYLCVGYVNEFPTEPELAQAGWAKKRPLSWVVHEETYGRRALPGEEPHSVLQETLRGIRPLDAKALGEAWDRQKRMTKPAGSLGMLEIISAQLCGLSRKCPPPIPEPACVAIFAGDHGVHAQGVTHWPQEVTAQMVANFLAGGAVVNAFAAQLGAEVCVVDVGVASELPPAIDSGRTTGLLPRKVRPGTADMTVEPAMTREEALRALEVGIETARDLVAAGNKALVTGDMGIANTTAAAALICVFTGEDPSVVTGRGTGIDDETHARKIAVVREALALHRPDPADPIGVLAAVGGLEHAALAGFMLGAASLRTPVILDGVIAGSAALVAKAIAPEVLAACVAGHRSAEPGHKAALAKLGLRPLIDLDLRLGEGTGALLALPLVQSAARAMHDVATFDSAGVTEKH